MIRVVSTTESNVPIYRYVSEKNERTGEIRHLRQPDLLRMEKHTREEVVFSGSEDAFKIWQVRCDVPPSCEITRKLRRD